jgi:hypothetical protein
MSSLSHTYTICTYIFTTQIIHHRSPFPTHPPSPLFLTSEGTQHWFLQYQQHQHQVDNTTQHTQYRQHDLELEAEAKAAAAAVVVADAAMSSSVTYSYGQPGHGGYGGGHGSGHDGMEPTERGGHRSMEGQGMGRGMGRGMGQGMCASMINDNSTVDWMGRSTHTMRSDEVSSASSASSVESRARVRRSPVPMSDQLNRGKLIDTQIHHVVVLVMVVVWRSVTQCGAV